MRCLYCGKELALLKRWTGGGEFCSDAHRQQYQEEYNKLALNRLLQAQQPGESKQSGDHKQSGEGKPSSKTPAAKPQPETKPVAAKTAVVQPAAAPALAPAVAKAPAEPPKPAPKKIEEPVPQPAVAVAVEPEEEAEEIPVEATEFFLELPLPAPTEATLVSKPEYQFACSQVPLLPARVNQAWESDLVAAGHIVLQPSDRVMDSARPAVERKLEVREFVRTAPIAEFELRAAGETGLMEISEEPMEILIFPHPPQGSPPLWQEAEQDFTFNAELGALALTPFGTTGIQDNVEDAGSSRVPESAPQPAAKTEPPAPTAIPPKAVVVEPAPKPIPAAAPVGAASAAPAPKAEPKPEPKPEPKFEPKIVSKPMFARPPLAKPAETPVPAPAAKTPEQKPANVPGMATKPLPLTLHGLAAGRGKPVQVFAAAVPAGVDVQIPRSHALPLRPVMILAESKIEPAKVEPNKIEERKPSERTVVVKTEPKRPQPARPDPRFANGKGRKPEVRISEPEPEKVEEKIAAPVAAAAAKEAAKEKTPEPVLEKKPAAEITPPQPKSELKESAAKEAPVREAPAKPGRTSEESRPAPLSAPYTTPDLGLPNLSLETSGGFFSRLPIAAKAGGALLLIAGVIAIAMLGRGKGSGTGAGEIVPVGNPLPVVDSGWITDWGAEPGVRKQHEISVLRPSLNLSDYRVEFEAQIDSKALGWVYRAKDGKNYYVNRLEIVKPGLDPTVALVRFAVINGEEQPRSQFPLSIPVHLDTLYKIRFDAVGDRFTTYVQGQKVDEWSDARIKVGGVGLYNERGERMSLKGGVSVVPLAIRK